MSNSSCPAPFLDASLYPDDQGYVQGRLCSSIPLPGSKSGTVCCLPCPFQEYTLYQSSLEALHANDIVNVIGVGVGAFILLSFIFLPEKVTHRSSLGIAISLAAFLINFGFIFPLNDLRSVQCANDITPANQSSNPICGFQGALHVFAGHSIALLVVCRTIYLHCQICWNLHVTRIPLIVLNIIGWAVPAVFLGAAFGVAEITYTISDHCSIRVDWIVDLLIIPIIIEIGCAVVVQITTFVYCVNVYLRSLNEPAPPTNDSFGETAVSSSVYSTGSGRYPYRKAMKRVHKVLRLQWRAWAQCFALVFAGTIFAVSYYILATNFVSMEKTLVPGQTPNEKVLLWAVCLIQNHGNTIPCQDAAAQFLPNQTMLVVAEFCIATCWVWVSLIFLRLSFFPEWIRLIRRTFTRIRYRNHRTSSSSSHSNRSDFLIHLHPPSKDFVSSKTTPLEMPYQHNAFQFPKMGFELPSPAHTKSESQATIIANAVRPGSSRPGSARPTSQRSNTLGKPNTLVKKDKTKKISVEDILAMRRLEQGSQQTDREYPGIQPTMITRMTAESEGAWPTYQFGQDGNGWNQV